MRPVSPLAAFYDPAPMALPELGRAEAKILDAARRCVLRYGSQKVSMNDVAREAGVSRGTVYNYFRDRDGLIDAVMAIGTQCAVDEIAQAMTSGDRFERQVVAGAQAMLAWSHISRPSNWLTEAERIDAIHVLSGRMLIQLVPVVAKLVRDGQERGELRADLAADAAAEWVLRIVFSLLMLPTVTFRVDRPKEVERFLRAHIVSGLA